MNGDSRNNWLSCALDSQPQGHPFQILGRWFPKPKSEPTNLDHEGAVRFHFFLWTSKSGTCTRQLAYPRAEVCAGLRRQAVAAFGRRMDCLLVYPSGAESGKRVRLAQNLRQKLGLPERCVCQVGLTGHFEGLPILTHHDISKERNFN